MPKIFPKKYFDQISMKKVGLKTPCCPQGLGWYRAIARSQPSIKYCKVSRYLLNVNAEYCVLIPWLTPGLFRYYLLDGESPSPPIIPSNFGLYKLSVCLHTSTLYIISSWIYLWRIMWWPIYVISTWRWRGRTAGSRCLCWGCGRPAPTRGQYLQTNHDQSGGSIEVWWPMGGQYWGSQVSPAPSCCAPAPCWPPATYWCRRCQAATGESRTCCTNMVSISISIICY